MIARTNDVFRVCVISLHSRTCLRESQILNNLRLVVLVLFDNAYPQCQSNSWLRNKVVVTPVFPNLFKLNFNVKRVN